MKGRKNSPRTLSVWISGVGTSTICRSLTYQVGHTNDEIYHMDLLGAGLIAGGEPDDLLLVQQLAEEYISKDSCIILLTIACESKFAFTFVMG
jgi:hypothetical protein